jgi:hypothetical protein
LDAVALEGKREGRSVPPWPQKLGRVARFTDESTDGVAPQLSGA